MDRRDFIKLSLGTLAVSAAPTSAANLPKADFPYGIYREIWFNSEKQNPEAFLSKHKIETLEHLVTAIKTDYQNNHVLDANGFTVSKTEVAYFATQKQ